MSAGDNTRERLLDAAAKEILENGFRAASLDAILSRTGVTKGALYHHFPSKKDLGLAVIDEVYRPAALAPWLKRLADCDDPVTAITDMLQVKSSSCSATRSVRCGCPMNNLAQEMASVDEDFRLKVESVFHDWRTAIADALERGKAEGFVRDNLDTMKAATFITCVIEGAVGAAKNSRQPEIVADCMETLQTFIQTVRPRTAIRAVAAR